ncbi:MAG TPA: homocysteine S-methyltransferase family protein [Candidatus Saccharimonadia bacterium]|nr:homocysteine S-methyltransferase family protein [Candidatus Saccharimonadia bacterium]
MEKLQARLATGDVVVMDGGVGTEVERRGIQLEDGLWSATPLFTEEGRQVVRDVHFDSIMAGAGIIITDNFRTQWRTLNRAGYGDCAAEITIEACKLAREAREDSGQRDVVIAGSSAPLEDCYSPEKTPPLHELLPEHDEHARNLAEGGVDLILAETMITLAETEVALSAARETGLPVAISFCCDEWGKNLLSGESLEDAYKLAKDFDPVFVGINCVSMKAAGKALVRLGSLSLGRNEIPLAVYAQGDDHKSPHHNGDVDYETEYIDSVNYWLELGAQAIGGCCGVTTDDVRNISQAVAKGRFPNALARR